MENNYSDIINMEHHSSNRHAHMSMHQRAGQFSPFAALTGYDEAVEETSKKAAKNYEAAGLFYAPNEDDI